MTRTPAGADLDKPIVAPQELPQAVCPLGAAGRADLRPECTLDRLTEAGRAEFNLCGAGYLKPPALAAILGLQLSE